MFSARWARAAVAAVSVPTLVVVGAVLGAGTASADEVYPRPADNMIDLRGHGWGHGIGMSQYGALGGARQGRTWQEIVGHYYTGTGLGSIGTPTIRVRVASLGTQVRVLPASGLHVYFLDQKPARALPAAIDGVTVAQWQLTGLVSPVPGQANPVIVRYLPTGSSTWRTWTTGPGQVAAFVNLTSAQVTALRGSDRVVYRGQVRGALIGPVGQETMTSIIALPMEDYLRTVVPSESPASWPAAALRAQAVAARSFAEWHRRNAPLNGSWYDVVDTVQSQVFKPTSVNGASNEYASTNSAILDTARQAVWYAGGPAFTQFSSSSGGWTATGSQPYLKAVADPWDAVADNPNHTWTTRVAVSSVERAYPGIGSYERMRITQRSGGGADGGRVERLLLEGSAGTASITGNQMRSVFGLKSNWFIPTDGSAPSFPRDVTGDRKADVLAVESATGALRVYRTNGAGGWGAMSSPEPSGWDLYAKALTAGTWDADAVSDVVVQDDAGTLFLRSGRGDGSFAPSVRIGEGWDMHNLVFPVGDFGGDGFTDLLARRATDGALWLYEGNGDGGFKAYRKVGTGWGGFTAILSPGDLDGDGHHDVLARTASGELYLYPGNGAGGWRSRSLVGSGWHVFTALTGPGDVTGDARADVLARDAAGRLYLYRGNGAGGVQPRTVMGTGWQIFSSILQ